MSKFLFFLLSFAFFLPPLCSAQNSAPDSLFEKEIHRFINAWHHAAAVADEATFFGSMAADAMYVGTDASERWRRDELKTWSKKYFDGDSAWAFKVLQRHIYHSDDWQYVWFDETLDTSMSVCRGSGVLRRQPNGAWLFQQYVLSAAVPNDVMKDYLKILKK